jgi:hypothetical protein
MGLTSASRWPQAQHRRAAAPDQKAEDRRPADHSAWSFLMASLILKLHAHKITSSPNDLAAANVMKIIECQFEVHWQDIEVLQSNSRAATRYIADVARKYAALFIEKQQCTL